MSHTISIANQKGGVGKSTTAHALGAGLHLRGYRVLLVDLDPQGNITYTTGLDEEEGNIYDLIAGRADVVEVIQKTQTVDVIPAGRGLTRLDIELTSTGKEYRLKEALEPVRKEYDYIIIDTPPALGLLTINALTASDSVIIPSQADIFSLQGIGQLYETIEAVKRYCNPALSIRGILLTRHNTRAILSRDMADLIETTAQQINTTVYKAVIRECISIREAQASKMDIYAYAPRSNASKDYTAFIEEAIGGGTA